MSILPVGIGPQEGGYEIERSLRFNSADSAYLSRTPASAGNRKTWTWSGWIKKSSLTTDDTVFMAGASAGDCVALFFNNDNTFGVYSNGAVLRRTTQVFRDPSAWYHFVVAMDTTQATANNRVKVYVNGSEITAFGTTANPTQNADLAINNTTAHYTGFQTASIGISYYNGYMTEINFIDGQALDPTSFGEYNTDTGVWQPKAYTGSYGTNGFYLDFADNSSTTALGYDAAGSNDWTPNNFSVTAGAGNDSLVDTPTPYGTDTGAGGEVRGNYCTLNPLNSAGATLSNGNLDCVTAVSGGDGARGTMAVTSGKWYWEFTPTNNGNQSFSGIALTTTAAGSYYVAYYANTGNKFVIGSGSSAYGATYTNNDVIGVALDLDSGTKTVTFYKNNVSQGAITITPSDPVLPIVDDGSGSVGTTFNVNFGQRPFAYTAPSGFKALCTQNLPEPAIADGSTAFNAVLYTGNGSTQSITGVNFQPDWLWLKTRSATGNHAVWDVLRGTSARLRPSSTSAEDTNAITSFDSDGFTLGTEQNASATTYVAWNWKAGGTGVSNTAGTITSTVSANTTAGFSIVTYSATGSAATVGHGLGVAPKMVIVKCRGPATTYSWAVWHTGLSGASYVLSLNTTDAQNNWSTVFNGTAPTSSVFSVGTDSWTNYSGNNYVAYCFAPVEGYSAFGSYVGNGSTDGPFVYTGFRPKFILLKNTTNYDWHIFDAERNTFNLVNSSLKPDTSGAEYTNNDVSVDLLSNGFKFRGTDLAINGSGNTHIYAAFAEHPFRYSLAR